MAKKHEFGLLIDYEYCTGCHTCQVACAQEHGWPAGMGGIRVSEIFQKLPKGKYYLTYIPFPTELCILCKPRTKKGLEPACVKHCMAGCMKYAQRQDRSYRPLRRLCVEPAAKGSRGPELHWRC